MSGATVTSDMNGTSVTYPPMSAYAGGSGGNNQAVWRAEEFLAFLLNQQSQNEATHHILAREAQIQDGHRLVPGRDPDRHLGSAECHQCPGCGLCFEWCQRTEPV